MLAGDDLFDQRLVDEHVSLGQVPHGRFEAVVGNHIGIARWRQRIAWLVRCFAVTIAESGCHGNQRRFTREKRRIFPATYCETLSILLTQVKRNRWERTQNHARMEGASRNRGRQERRTMQLGWTGAR